MLCINNLLQLGATIVFQVRHQIILVGRLHQINSGAEESTSSRNS